MHAISKDTLANVLFTLHWSSDRVQHRDSLVAQKLNLWRDYFPAALDKAIEGLTPGQSVRVTLAAGKHLPGYQDRLVHRLERSCFKPRDGQVMPKTGRFYPQGVLCTLPGIFPQNTKPFRITEVTDTHCTADLNHPLVAFPMELEITALDVWPKSSEVGGQSIDWRELVLDGPGLKARHGQTPTVFHEQEPLERPAAQPDLDFYQTPRMVSHVDSKARELLAAIHGQILPGRMRILDLMAGYESHLPVGHDAEVTGLGMNAEEMAANPALARHVVHDLNAEPTLPFATASFDAAICSLSVDYMTRPHAVFAELARVLTPGAPCVMAVSNRWFPNQATNLWTEMHEFERVGFMVECFLQSGQFSDVHTISERGWPRPQDARDRYYPSIQHSDPVHVAWATVSQPKKEPA